MVKVRMTFRDRLKLRNLLKKMTDKQIRDFYYRAQDDYYENYDTLMSLFLFQRARYIMIFAKKRGIDI